MTELFWYVADAAFAAGWVVLALCLFRLLYRRYLPRWLAVLMWGLVAIRLICPLGIESDMSVMPEPLSHTVNTYWAQTNISVLPSETPSVELDAPMTEPIVSESTPEAPAVAWETIACVVWLVGVTAMVGYMAISYAFLHGSVRTATKREGVVYECEMVESPFILGVIHPHIYLPYDMRDSDRDHALAHEQAHLSRGDHIWKLAAFVLLCIYWFQPLLWLAYILFCRDIEFACDEKVIKHLSQDQRKDYSHALLSLAVTHRARMCPLAFGEVGVEARVKTVMKYRKPLRTLVVVSVIGCTIAAWWLLTDPPAPARTTLENARVYVVLEGDTVSETNSLLVEEGNRVSLPTDDGKPLQLQIERIDLDDMSVTLSASQTLYYPNKVGSQRVSVDMRDPLVLRTAKNGGSEVHLTLSLPSTAASIKDNEDLTETVYLGDSATLRLYDNYYSLEFHDERADDISGTYTQTKDTLTLTQDAHLTEYVFHKSSSGVWQYDADASYRHKLASSPKLGDGLRFTLSYRCEIKLVNQHYRTTISKADGGVVFAGYSAFGVKPTITALSPTSLRIVANVPAADPKMQQCTLDLVTGKSTAWEVVS